jgi:WD40 repeat protein
MKSDHRMVPTILIPARPHLLIESLCIHESGSVVCAAYSDTSLIMWSPQTGEILLKQHRSACASDKSVNHVWCSMMIDDCRCLVGCSDGQIEFYSLNARTRPWTSSYRDLGGITHLVRASPTAIVGTTRRGYLIAFQYGNDSIREVYVKRLHQWPIRVCHVDSTLLLLLTGSDDHSIKVTHLSNGLPVHTLRQHQAPVNCLALDPVSLRFRWVGDMSLVRHSTVFCELSHRFGIV